MKILIADDEDYTREGLMESIDWNKFGIDEVMQAANGQEALKIAKWFHPDIMLTDTRMPKQTASSAARSGSPAIFPAHPVRLLRRHGAGAPGG